MLPALSRIFSTRNIVIDIIVLGCIYFIPALAHMASFPVYLFDPMRIFMLAGFLLTRQNAQAYFLAVTIPLFSFLVTGHPLILKACLVSFELTVNVFILISLLNRTRIHPAISLLTSIFVSKIAYYSFKAALIGMGVLEGDLVTTPLLTQLYTCLLITALFSFFRIISGNRKEIS